MGFWQYADPEFHERAGLILLFAVEFFLFTSTFAQTVIVALPVSSFRIGRSFTDPPCRLYAFKMKPGKAS